MDIDKLEQLTNARKKTWLALHGAIGAEAAAKAFYEQCREAMVIACTTDEAAAGELYEFIRAEASKPE